MRHSLPDTAEHGTMSDVPRNEKRFGESGSEDRLHEEATGSARVSNRSRGRTPAHARRGASGQEAARQAGRVSTSRAPSDEVATTEAADVREGPSRAERVLFRAIVVTFLLLLGLGELFIYRTYLNPRVSSKAQRDYLYYVQVLAEDPENVDAYLALAEAYLKQGDEKKAIETLERARKVDARDYRPAFEIGRLYYMKGDFERAQEYLQSAWKISPNNAYTAYFLGLIAYRQKKLPLSAYYLKKTVEFAPELADAHLLLAQIYESLQATESAIREYRETLKYLPDSVEANEGLRRLMRARETGGSRTSTASATQEPKQGSGR